MPLVPVICTFPGTCCRQRRSRVWPQKNRGCQSAGQFLTVWKVSDNSWDSWDTIDVSSPVLLISPYHWSRWPFVWRPACDVAFIGLRDAMVRAPILAFPTESGDYMLDTDASNFGLGGVLSQIQNGVECVIVYCSRALRPSQRKYCTTKREMLAVVSMYIQFRSYLRGARFTLRTDHKSLVWLHRFKDTGRHDG